MYMYEHTTRDIEFWVRMMSLSLHAMFEFEGLKWLSSPPVSGLRSEIRLEQEVGYRQSES